MLKKQRPLVLLLMKFANAIFNEVYQAAFHVFHWNIELNFNRALTFL